MEQRRFSGNSHWYHETQVHLPTARDVVLADSATITDQFLPGLVSQLTDELKTTLQQAHTLRTLSSTLYSRLFPQQSVTCPAKTLTPYDRFSNALTVAQVTGIQRLCQHYATQLNPLTCPDASRESHYRLTQMTEYVRQLASQPTLIDCNTLQRLTAVGLTVADIISCSQIVGFISYQARVIAGLHALMAFSPRWSPTVTVPPDATVMQQGEWRPTQVFPPCPPPTTPWVEQDTGLPPSVASLLAQDDEVRLIWGELLTVLQHQHTSASAALAAAVVARINGSSDCFWRYPASTLRDALQHSVEHALAIATPQQQGVIMLASQLTRQPDRLNHAHLQPLYASGLSGSEIFDIILVVAGANWSNRLMQSLGTIDQPAGC